MLLHAMETPSTFKLQKFHWYETLCDHSGTHFTYAVSTCGMLTWTVSIYKLQLTVSIISCPRHCQPYHCTYTRIHPALLTTAPVCSLFYLPCFVGWQLHTQNTFPFQRGRNTGVFYHLIRYPPDLLSFLYLIINLLFYNLAVLQ
jgi:hypothetical protein